MDKSNEVLTHKDIRKAVDCLKKQNIGPIMALKEYIKLYHTKEYDIVFKNEQI